MEQESTWKPYIKHGELSEDERSELPDSAYAFPAQRKLLLTDASHVLKALARFHQVQDVTDDDRALAFENIKLAGEFYNILVVEENWRQIGKKPHYEGPGVG